MQRAVRPARAPHEDPGYSYFSDGKGWESKPGANGQPGQAPGAGAPGAPGVPAPGAPAAGATAVGAAAIGATTVGAYGAGGDATSVYGGRSRRVRCPGAPRGPAARPGTARGPGGPFGPGPGGPVGPGPGGPGGPGPVPAVPPARRPPGAAWRGRQAQGQLVAALDLEEGARPHRRRVRHLRACPVRRLSSTCRAARRSPPRSQSATYQNTTVYYSDGKTVLGTIGAHQPAGPDLQRRSR